MRFMTSLGLVANQDALYLSYISSLRSVRWFFFWGGRCSGLSRYLDGRWATCSHQHGTTYTVCCTCLASVSEFGSTVSLALTVFASCITSPQI